MRGSCKSGSEEMKQEQMKQEQMKQHSLPLRPAGEGRGEGQLAKMQLEEMKQRKCWS